MKLKQLILYTLSLLLASCFSTSVYGDQSQQKINDGNQCPTQIRGNNNNVTCNITPPRNSEPPNSSPENRQNPLPPNLNNQLPQSKWCGDSKLSNEDKHVLQCSGY